MNMRDDWTIGENESLFSLYYDKKESIQSVKDNFDFRRNYTAEGYDIVINGVMERCLVQTSSNPLRELNDYRKIQCPITADVKRGYYVKYEGTVWLIDTNVVNVDGAYLSTRMSRCQYLLRWQNKDGKIIERWGYSSDQTKYSNGETGNSTMSVGDNQYCLMLPIDEETKQLKRGMRFAMDFEDAEEPDVYRLTNRKVNLNNELYFDRGGTMTITLSINFFNNETDKRVKLDDGIEAWICDYMNDELTSSTSGNYIKIIQQGEPTVVAASRGKTFTAKIFDKYNVEINGIIAWDLTCLPENNKFVSYEIMGNNSIKIKCDYDQDIIGTKLLLKAFYKNISNSIFITIGGGI